MYIVRDTNNDIIIIATKEQDAAAYVQAAALDNQYYTIEDTQEDEYLEQKFLEIQDGIGEGQVW
jgi:hypothetical protein